MMYIYMYVEAEISLVDQTDPKRREPKDNGDEADDVEGEHDDVIVVRALRDLWAEEARHEPLDIVPQLEAGGRWEEEGQQQMAEEENW